MRFAPSSLDKSLIFYRRENFKFETSQRLLGASGREGRSRGFGVIDEVQPFSSAPKQFQRCLKRSGHHGDMWRLLSDYFGGSVTHLNVCVLCRVCLCACTHADVRL